jgi:hypothetical protein
VMMVCDAVGADDGSAVLRISQDAPASGHMAHPP